MALTTRTNGSSAGNLVGAAWFNDFKDLLTGVMTDQPVIISNSLALVNFAAPGSAPSGSTSNASANLGVGTYQYCFTYVNNSGAESPPSPTFSITTTSGHQQVNLTSISTGPAGITRRNVYRTTVGGTAFLQLTTIINNTSTTFTDNVADGSITSFQPQVGTGGVMLAASGGLLQGYVGSSTNNGGTVRVHGNGRVELTYNGAEPSKISYFDSNGLTLWGALASGQSVIRVGNSLGLKNVAGTKLLEVKSSGNVIISGNQYATSAGSISTPTGAVFDGFDMAEVFEVDREYPPGTILCPQDTDTEIPFTLEVGAHRNQPKLTQCSHDACALALISVANPGFLAGQINLPSLEEYDSSQPTTMACSMTGRVFARTAYHIPGRSYVCSDGRGGVRPVQKGESVMSLGVTLGPTSAAKVPLLIRPTFVRLP